MSDPLSHPVCLRLPESIDKELRRQAEEQKRPYAQFLRLWMLERLEELDEERFAKVDLSKLSPEEREEFLRMMKREAEALSKPSPFISLLKGGDFPKDLGNPIRVIVQERAPIAQNEGKPLTDGDCKR